MRGPRRGRARFSSQKARCSWPAPTTDCGALLENLQIQICLHQLEKRHFSSPAAQSPSSICLGSPRLAASLLLLTARNQSLMRFNGAHGSHKPAAGNSRIGQIRSRLDLARIGRANLRPSLLSAAVSERRVHARWCI